MAFTVCCYHASVRIREAGERSQADVKYAFFKKYVQSLLECDFFSFSHVAVLLTNS